MHGICLIRRNIWHLIRGPWGPHSWNMSRVYDSKQAKMDQSDKNLLAQWGKVTERQLSDFSAQNLAYNIWLLGHLRLGKLPQEAVYGTVEDSGAAILPITPHPCAATCVSTSASPSSCWRASCETRSADHWEILWAKKKFGTHAQAPCMLRVIAINDRTL